MDLRTKLYNDNDPLHNSPSDELLVYINVDLLKGGKKKTSRGSM